MAALVQTRDRDNHLKIQSGVMLTLAIQYRVHNLNHTFFTNYGYQVKLQILDCQDNIQVLRAALVSFREGATFFIGPYSSETSYLVSILTSVFQIATISYSASYTDFPQHGLSNAYMLRTIPSDWYRIQAALDFIQEMEWNYVGVINSYNYDGVRDGSKFILQLKKLGICLAESINLPKNTTDSSYFNAVESLNRDKRLKVLVMFTTTLDSRRLLFAMSRRNLSGRFYILCMYGCTDYVEVPKSLAKVVVGVLSLDLRYKEVDGFKKYFLQQNPKSNLFDYFKHYWENIFQCNLDSSNLYKKNCSGNETLSDKHYVSSTSVHTAVRSVDVIEEILNLFFNLFSKISSFNIKSLKSDIKDRAIFNYLAIDFSSADGTIQKDKYQYIQYDINQYTKHRNNTLVATWKIKSEKNTTAENLLKRTKGQLIITPSSSSIKRSMQSKCSNKCPLGRIAKPDKEIEKAKCCWSCKKIPNNHIIIYNFTRPCKQTENPNRFFNACVPLPVKVIQFDQDAAPSIIIIICIIGISSTIIVVLCYVIYDKYKIIRASGRDLCYMILIGIFFIFVSPLLFLCEPTPAICLLRSSLPGVSFLCCYVPLFLKVHRIYRIFMHAEKTVKRPTMVSSRSLLLSATAVVLAQVAIMGVWCLTNLPKPIAHISTFREHITMHCTGDRNPIWLCLNLFISVFFILACTVLAFKTRNFPKNYNEAKHIGVTLYITCITWSVFIPAYFLLPENDFVREYFMCGICIAIGFITLIGLFGYRINMLANKKHLKPDNNSAPSWNLSQSKSVITNRGKSFIIAPTDEVDTAAEEQGIVSEGVHIKATTTETYRMETDAMISNSVEDTTGNVEMSFDGKLTDALL